MWGWSLYSYSFLLQPSTQKWGTQMSRREEPGQTMQHQTMWYASLMHWLGCIGFKVSCGGWEENFKWTLVTDQCTGVGGGTVLCRCFCMYIDNTQNAVYCVEVLFTLFLHSRWAWMPTGSGVCALCQWVPSGLHWPTARHSVPGQCWVPARLPLSSG